MTFGSLFSGIGGMDLGLERAGLRCVWQVEVDPYARRVLQMHWPDLRRHDDVRTFPTGDGTDWRCDLIAGGFPCQDISYAGSGAGLDGERSGLWWEFGRVVRVVRPRIVLVENVAALLGRGLDAVLGTLAALGYDAEWHCVPAAAVGAPHIRDRVFVLADAVGQRVRPEGRGADDGAARGVPGTARQQRVRLDAGAACGADAAAPDADRQRRAEQYLPALAARAGKSDRLGDGDGQWRTEPAVGRVAHGIPRRVDRLRGLGNAVVPQVAEWIGRRIIEAVGEANP